MINLLERRTNIICGSLNKAGMAEVAKVFRHEFSAVGFAIDTLPGGRIHMLSCPGSDHSIDLADHALSYKSSNGKRLLLMGHLYTALPPYSPFQSYRRGSDRVPGPGVADKKDGQTVMQHALRHWTLGGC